MYSYIFLLGRNFLLSSAEIFNLLDNLRIDYVFKGNSLEALLIDTKEELDVPLLQSSLGGTVSIGELENIIDRKTARRIKAEKDLINVNYSDKKIIGRVLSTQNIEEYKQREFEKPYFDIKSGQISSKLAQIMVNLSLTKNTKTIYDPFCATGTINIEATRLGFDSIGSDINPEAIHGARENLHWYHKILKAKNPQLNLPSFHFFISDVRNITENLKKREMSADTIVTEGYLGKPRHYYLDMNQQTQKEINQLDELAETSLTEYSKILPKGSRVVTVIPAFRGKTGTIRLTVRDKFENLGYNIPSLFKENFNFEGRKQEFLIFRKGAVVLREIFVLELI